MANKKLLDLIKKAIQQNNGWLSFDAFMNDALYALNHGYYIKGRPIFGHIPEQDYSDFVTAPEISPLFGRMFARVIAEALQETQCHEVWEFGAGTGALAHQIMTELSAMNVDIRRYCIVDLSGHLVSRQRERLADVSYPVIWQNRLPDMLEAVVIGNEVLDAMPVKLLHRVQGQWMERGVALKDEQIIWCDKPTNLRPPMVVTGHHNYLTEIHHQANAFIQTLARTLQKGAAFFVDYGFPEHEYYHEQRHMGTLMCHQLHKADTNPLVDIGDKDITAHINFTEIAVAAQHAGMEVLGYTSQANFLLNCGLVQTLETLSLSQRVAAKKLIDEHEMGELFKIIGLVKGPWFDSLAFHQGDRTHRLSFDYA